MKFGTCWDQKIDETVIHPVSNSSRSTLTNQRKRLFLMRVGHPMQMCGTRAIPEWYSVYLCIVESWLKSIHMLHQKAEMEFKDPKHHELVGSFSPSSTGFVKLQCQWKARWGSGDSACGPTSGTQGVVPGVTAYGTSHASGVAVGVALFFSGGCFRVWWGCCSTFLQIFESVARFKTTVASQAAKVSVQKKQHRVVPVSQAIASFV